MFSLLLKKALPFTLTFVVGTALGGLTWLFGAAEKKAETPLVTRTYDFGPRCGNAHHHNLVAVTKPLVILFKPDARRPRELRGTDQEHIGSLWVSVTFGADGKVQDVKPSGGWAEADKWGMADSDEIVELKATLRAVERAARQIQFEPETVNSIPVSVTKEVEIWFMAE
jgi:hypothetical protein